MDYEQTVDRQSGEKRQVLCVTEKMPLRLKNKLYITVVKPIEYLIDLNVGSSQ